MSHSPDACRSNTPRDALESVLLTLTCKIATSARLRIRMPHAAPWHKAYSSASHDDSVTSRRVELQCLMTQTFVDIAFPVDRICNLPHLKVCA